MEELKPGQKIEKVRIPSEDMVNWINTLKESGFSETELDNMMSGLNFEYGRLKSPEDVRQALDQTMRLVEKHPMYRSLTPEKKQMVKEAALEIAKIETSKTNAKSQKKTE